MDKNQIDEPLKIKKLKEQENSESINRPNSKKHIAIFIFGAGVIMLVCVCMGVGLMLIQNRGLINTNPININAPINVNTPTYIATTTSIPVFENQYELTVTSLSTQLTSNSSSTITFQINYASGVDNGLCTGHFEIIDMARLRKIYEKNYTEENDSKTSGLWITLIASDGKRTDHSIGGEIALFDGDVGQADFHLANEPQFRQVANRFSDGESNWVVQSSTFMNDNGRPNGGSGLGTPEWEFFDAETDLNMYEIRMIRRDINKLIIQPNYYLLDIVWSFWELDEQSKNEWLYVEPTTGTLSPNESQTILIEFSSQSLEIGTYTTELLIDFGEKCSTPVTIPITLTITED